MGALITGGRKIVRLSSRCTLRKSDEHSGKMKEKEKKKMNI